MLDADELKTAWLVKLPGSRAVIEMRIEPTEKIYEQVQKDPHACKGALPGCVIDLSHCYIDSSSDAGNRRNNRPEK